MSSSSPSRFLVTGATGFIGRRLVFALVERGHSVTALVRRAADARLPAVVARRPGDLAVPESLRQVCAGADVVLHLASHAETEDCDGPADENAHRRVTVEGTRRLLDEARAAGARRFVFLSSVKAMGEGGEERLDETSPPRPVTAYGRAKLEAEKQVTEAGAGMETCVLRLPMVYGPNRRGSLMRMIAAIDRGRFPPLPEVGNRRSMVHVDDVVQAVLLAAAREPLPGRLYLVTDGVDYSARGIYEAICRALDRRVPAWTVPRFALVLGARAGDAIERLTGKRMPLDSDALRKLLGSACYDSARIVRELGFRPAVTLERALPEMIRAYREPLSSARAEGCSGS